MIRNRQTRFAYPSHLGAASDAAAAASPLTAGISAGVGLATTAAALWMANNRANNNAKTATTLIVNGLAEQLENLKQAYLRLPAPSCADQRAALNLYDEAWLWLQSGQACGNPNFGSAGNRCISDRAPDGLYPWRTYYRDPIANDPRVSACDTSNEILLPSLSSGGFVPAGTSVNPSPAGMNFLSPEVMLIGALGIGALLLTR